MRRMVIVAVAASAALFGGVGDLRAWPVERPLPVVATTTGRVAGLQLDSGIKAWLGVPYAQPPTGPLRWRPPEHISWRGVWNADRKMPECVQVLRAHDINHYYGEEATSEDCLYLNIWAPAGAHPAARLPVIVYIYGGGFTIGSAGIPTYGGEIIARRGVVFVNFNYRVGILGFLAHPQLTREQAGHSGNYGLLDQTLALQWIHDNIGKFGGDPQRILVIGQSAGAGSVAYHLFSPLSRGLFSRAMMSSGCNFTANLPSLADGERNGLEIQTYLGAGSLADLRNVPADRLVAAQLESQIGVTVRKGVRAVPVIDGYFLTRPLQETLEAHAMTVVPIIASFNKEESASPFVNALSADEYRGIARRIYGADADGFLQQYPAPDTADLRAAGIRVAREGGLENNARTCAQLQARFNHAKTYIDMFSRHHAFAPGVHIADYDVATTGAYHTADIPFWFGTIDAFNLQRHTRDWSATDYALSDRMMDALVAFAATGDPSTRTVAWPAWDPGHEVKLEWGGDSLAAIVPINVTGIEWLKSHPAYRFDALPPSLGARD
ncbi:MAG TPA: carboxylesterase family protein [Steroidobacteraceae bacterium]|nr:carboxylesterase family protein [Steroidobacteraceae bacterium]